jgi:Protein of unknown function (DUF4058)
LGEFVESSILTIEAILSKNLGIGVFAMPSPFPGMDPYLETPDLWPDVHHKLISEIQTALVPGLRPRYVARVELRVYVADEDDPHKPVIPDVRVEKSGRNGGKRAETVSTLTVAEPLIVPLLDEEIEEAYLEIRQLETGQLVTIIEVLSPTNKVRSASGRTSFMKKRQETLNSNVHWVEIDLLRAGTPSVTRPPLRSSDYRILVSRAENRDEARYWPVNLRQMLPIIGIPLRKPDPDAPLDLGAVLQTAYDHAAYDLSVDYRKQPDPPLTGADRAWANRLLRERGLRS